jgi:hypothetical protein
MHTEFFSGNLKKSRGRHRRRKEYNIRMDLREMGWKVVDWMHMSQDMVRGGGLL